MKARTLLVVLFGTMSSVAMQAFADESVFCPSKNGYITVGMTVDQVRNACGAPTSVAKSDKPFMEKVEVTQYIFNNQGTQKGFYGVWAMPVATSASGNGGVKLAVNVIDDKIDSINLDGNGVNAFSICGRNLQVGDDAMGLQNACGTPSLVNKTFEMKPVPSRTKPETWFYKAGEYLPTLSLTFVDGKLQSISSSQ